MTNEELDALVNGLWGNEVTAEDIAEFCAAITTLRECLERNALVEARLRAQLAEARAERDGLLRAVTDNHVANARAERAEAARAAQIEVDAEICTYIIQNYDCMKADKETYQPMWVQKVAKGMVSLARQDIRNQPHDRTALDRHDAKTREKALREAADELRGQGYGNAVRTILALIEKPNAR